MIFGNAINITVPALFSVYIGHSVQRLLYLFQKKSSTSGFFTNMLRVTGSGLILCFGFSFLGVAFMVPAHPLR